MTTIIPPTAPQAPPSAPSTAPVVVVVAAPPAALARLPVGQLLEATVTTQNAKNLFQVQTPLGQLSIQTALPLPAGGALVLQLLSQSPTVQFQVNSLNGEPPSAVPKSANMTTLAAGVAAQNATKASGHAESATVAKLTPGSILQATVLRPTAQTTAKPTAQPASQALPHNSGAGAGAIKGPPAGQPGVNPALSKQSATPLTGLTKSQGQPATLRQGDANPAKAASGPALKGGGVLPPGSQLSVRITGVQLPKPGMAASSTTPSGGLTANPAATPGTSLSGTVTGSTPAGHTIVQTRAGIFALETQTVVPRGSVITLDVVTAPTPAAIKPGADQSLHQSMFSSRKWPALEQVMQVLHEESPATAQQLINSFTPRPDARLTSGLIFFLSALRGGDIRALIGDAPMRLIERTRPNLAGRVSEDFTALARMADEPGPGDWRVALIPINTGAEIEQIRLLMRQHGGEEENDTGNADSRFVIDVQLSRFGRMQLDGLIRNSGKSLELMVRSEAPLSETMHQDIRTIFVDASALTGLAGSVNFQAAPAHFIDIADPTSDQALGLVV